MNIWEDPWLSRPPSFRVISARKEGCRNNFVGDLLDPTNSSWKEDIVRSTFLPFEANEILDIPISSIPLDDVFVWHYGKSGLYTVKSGYSLLRSIKVQWRG